MSKVSADTPDAGRLSLAELDRVELGPRHTELLSRAGKTCGGHQAWVRRKLREAADLCAMAELGPRLTVLHLDLDVGLIAVLKLHMPVSCRRHAAEAVTLAAYAGLVLHYPECALRHPQPGSLFIEVLQPTSVFHPNIAPNPPYFLCLGPSMPAGIPCKELVLMTFAALAFQSVMLDPGEGVMNLAAARYFAENQDRLPLTNEPFVAPS